MSTVYVYMSTCLCNDVLVNFSGFLADVSPAGYNIAWTKGGTMHPPTFGIQLKLLLRSAARGQLSPAAQNHGKRKMENGKWKVGNGKWEVGNGK